MKLLHFPISIAIFVLLSLSLAAGEKHTNARNDIQKEPRVRRRRRGSKRRSVKENRSSGITDDTVDDNRRFLKCKGSSTCGDESESRSISLGCGKGDKGNCDRNIGQDRSFGCGKGDKGNCDRSIGQDRGFAFEQQVSVQETTPCELFQINQADRFDDRFDVDDQCLNNSCSGGCCRRLDKLVCDESNSLPEATCICNSNTANDHIRSPGTGGGTINVIQENVNNVIPVNVVALSIIDIITRNIDLSILSSLIIVNTDLEIILDGSGPFTIFAPTDAAFGKLSTEILTCLQASENRSTLLQLLKYHIVSGKVLSSTFIAGQYISLMGQPITVSTIIKINNDGNFVGTETEARNGIIHTIDTVLIPDWLSRQIKSICVTQPNPINTVSVPIIPVTLIEPNILIPVIVPDRVLPIPIESIKRQLPQPTPQPTLSCSDSIYHNEATNRDICTRSDQCNDNKCCLEKWCICGYTAAGEGCLP